MTMALNRWCRREEGGWSLHLILNYSSDRLWSHPWEFDAGHRRVLTEAERFRGRRTQIESELSGVLWFLAPRCRSVQQRAAEARRFKTDGVRSNKNPECPKCKPEVWIISCGIVGYWLESMITLARRGRMNIFFIINMQDLVVILEHHQHVCKWALPSLKHWWDPLREQRRCETWNDIYIWKCTKLENIKGNAREYLALRCFCSPLTCSGPRLEGIARAPGLWFSSTYYFILLQFQLLFLHH